jgi:hypothetical protein
MILFNSVWFKFNHWSIGQPSSLPILIALAASLVVMFTVPVAPALIACVAVAPLKSMVSATMLIFWFVPPSAISAPEPEINKANLWALAVEPVTVMLPPVEVTVYTTEADFIADNRTKLDAWKKSGLVFIGAGGGAMYAIKANTGPIAEVRLMQLFGSSGTVVSATIGYAHGF